MTTRCSSDAVPSAAAPDGHLGSTPGLGAEAVSFRYGDRPALADVTLWLQPGEQVALVGPNGSGKTTLLKVMTGLLSPTSGEVFLNGRRLHDLSPRDRARHIAVVSQQVDPSLPFTVEAMVAMGRSPHIGFLASPSRGDDEAVRRAIRESDLAGFERRRFAELSGGEQQRVVLAMALAQQTAFLLLDEPTVHLDLHHQHRLLELLVRLNAERKIGVLAVMHDLNLASLYFERLVVLSRGRVVANGAPAEVLREPLLRAVFNAPISLVTHPRTGASQVLLDRSVD